MAAAMESITVLVGSMDIYQSATLKSVASSFNLMNKKDSDESTELKMHHKGIL